MWHRPAIQPGRPDTGEVKARRPGCGDRQVSPHVDDQRVASLVNLVRLSLCAFTFLSEAEIAFFSGDQFAAVPRNRSQFQDCNEASRGAEDPLAYRNLQGTKQCQIQSTRSPRDDAGG